MNDKRLADDCTNSHPRIQRRVGILKNDLHPAPQPSKRFAIQRQQILTIEVNLSRCRLNQPEQRSSNRSLATAGLANQSKRLTLSDGKGYAIHRAHLLPTRCRKVFLQILDFEEVRQIECLKLMDVQPAF